MELARKSDVELITRYTTVIHKTPSILLHLTNLLVNLLMEKFYPWTSTLFQGSITGGQIVIKVLYGYFF